MKINKDRPNSKTSSDNINDTVSDNNGSSDNKNYNNNKNKNYNFELNPLINDKYNINDATISYIDHIAGGDITANHSIFSEINNNEASKKIVDYAKYGIPIIKMGNSGKKVMIISGIHGNELPPQVAIVNLISELVNVKINGTLYIVPFAAPKASMNNSRWCDSVDLNRNACVEGSPSNIILKKVLELGIDSVADFHSTTINANPGRQGVFCTKRPSIDSFFIGSYVANKTSSSLIQYGSAGLAFKGALEDECNLLNIPAITCEVVCENGIFSPRAYNESLAQMGAYLKYFNII
ncbi:MAG: hypothetical protein ACRC1M_07330 [Methanobacteriaceae archaeon]